jgi:hypothetical protein
MPIQRGEVYRVRLGGPVDEFLEPEHYGLVISAPQLSQVSPFAIILSVHGKSVIPTLEVPIEDGVHGFIRTWVLHTVKVERFVGEPLGKLASLERVEALLCIVMGLVDQSEEIRGLKAALGDAGAKLQQAVDRELAMYGRGVPVPRAPPDPNAPRHREPWMGPNEGPEDDD